VPTNAAIRRQITAQLVQAIERGVLPWRRPWRRSPNTGRAANVASKRPYNGINPLLLELHRMEHDLGSRWWGTFNQWSDLGCRVMRRPEHVDRGKWGCRIVFYRPVTKRHVDPETGDETEDRFFVMRQWTVFNADQVDGADEWQTSDDAPGDTIPDYAPAERLIAATDADVRQHGDRAYYKRPVGPWPDHHDGDYIVVPPKHRFDPMGSYYETILHELGHWSEVRLGWDHQQAGYAMGELVAEMAASFLSTGLGVPQGESLENHASYLKSWLKEMKDDPAFIFKASTQASKVCDYLLAFVDQEAPRPELTIVV
jgi:antirestriction protein ArdC